MPSLDFRHTCEQHQGMTGYGWDDYDARRGGRQTIHDEGNNIDIQTEFIKVEGGQHGILRLEDMRKASLTD
jgi:mannosyl-oligosaccharide glucosidase